jgi:hypothetical protein
VSTQPCPNNDKGICEIPDHTLVARGGSVTVRTREEIEAEFPSIDLGQSVLQKVGHPRVGELVDALEDSEDPVRSLLPFTSAGGHALADALLTRAASGTTVLVYCSPCGDVFTTSI